MWQAYTYPGWSTGAVEIPSDYDGVWRDWNHDGGLIYEREYQSGLPKYFKHYQKKSTTLILVKEERFSYSGRVMLIETDDYIDGKVKKSLKVTLTDIKKEIVIIIYDSLKSIDLRPQYAKEIARFEAELKKWTEEHQ